MNFFEAQERGRKNTVLLVSLFVAAVIILIIMLNLLVMVVLVFLNNDQVHGSSLLIQPTDWRLIVAVSSGVCLIIIAGSLYKILILSGGGKNVAEALGGSLIPQNTDHPELRRLLNVVEEMAIASGTPAPPVYVLFDEPGINAFAAGFSTQDAVIGVTQGAIDYFNRDQLQGVVAHEFSHIFNGDMRLNIRLMGILHGILMIGTVGYFIIRSLPRSSGGGKGNKGLAALALLGAGLMVVGYAGTLFGSLIKAAVSRQREFLADASAVQFTRNPNGIGGALKVIGGLNIGSRLECSGAAEVNHMLIAQGLSGFMKGLSDTHPPLPERIKRIEPHWNGEFISSSDKSVSPDEEVDAKDEKAARLEVLKNVAAVVAGSAMAGATKAVDQIGNPSWETILYARRLISELPIPIREAVRDPYGARAVIYSFLLDPEPDDRGPQLALLHNQEDPGVLPLLDKLLPFMDGLDVKFRLPLIEMAVPALKQLSFRQHKVFRKNLNALIKLDGKISLLEWSLQQIIFGHLDRQYFKPPASKVRQLRLEKLEEEVVLILSAMAYAGHRSQDQIEGAFRLSVESLKFGHIHLTAKSDVKISNLNRSLNKLLRLKPLDKKNLLKACAISVSYDQEVTSAEIEMLRAFSSVLDCPMPPVFTL